MAQKLTIRLTSELFEDLRDEALKNHISVSDIVRERIMRPKNTSFDSSSLQSLLEGTNQIGSKNQDILLTVTEIIFLLREFIFERNGQILKKIDQKMDQEFGKERKKIL